MSRLLPLAKPFWRGYNITMMRHVKKLWTALLLTLIFVSLLLTACGDEDKATPGEGDLQEAAAPVIIPTGLVVRDGDIWQPMPGTSWQWQLTGEIDTSFDVEMYDIDLFDAPQDVIDALHDDGRIVICYFSAGSWEEWRPDAADFPESVIGETLSGWPDERWLDIRQFDLIGPVMQGRLNLAASKDCDGVEPDNMTSYDTNSGFPISAQDQLDFNIWLAAEAHERRLSIGLKNDLEQVDDLLEHFDWALNEECFQYEECAALLPFVEAGKAVFGVEYEGKEEEYCPKANSFDFDWLAKDLDLDARRSACR